MCPSLGRRRQLLVGRLVDAVGGNGLLDAPCRSRVLESALALHLMREEDVAPGARERIARYLRTAQDDPRCDPLQRAVARAVLRQPPTGSDPADCVPADFDHFTAARKRLMFQIILAELGVTAFPRLTSLAAFDVTGQQSWLVVEMTALKVLHAIGVAEPQRITAGDWRTLDAAAHRGPVWESNHLARLLVLLALRRHPERRGAVHGGVLAVTRSVQPDGGLPFITDMNVFATVTGGLALAGAHCPAGLLLDLADALVAVQNGDGGWGFSAGVEQSDVDDTSYGVEFLRVSAAGRHAARITAAEHYLLAQRNDDGGFPTFARGTPSEVAMTAGAVNALATGPEHRRAVEEGVRFIVERQHPSGRFERSWSRNDTNAIFRAVLACGSLPDRSAAARRARLRAVRHVRATQDADGGWGHRPGDPSDPISTAYALIALSSVPATAHSAGRSLTYLMERQRSDGSFESLPDQTGPRPLLYDVPVLADICVLSSWNHALAAGFAPARPAVGHEHGTLSRPPGPL